MSDVKKLKAVLKIVKETEAEIKKQWDEFCNKLETLGKRIEDAQKEYGMLMTTRRHQLKKPLDKIEFLRAQ